MDWMFESPTGLEIASTNELDVNFKSDCNSYCGAYTLIVINDYAILTSKDGGEDEIFVTELDGTVKQSISV